MAPIFFCSLLFMAVIYLIQKVSFKQKQIESLESRKQDIERSMKRMDEVFAIRMAMIRAALCAPGGHEERMEIAQSVSLQDMLHSDKPVVLQSFYTEEQLQVFMGSLEGELAVQRAKQIINGTK